jgi:hypothetical protein
MEPSDMDATLAEQLESGGTAARKNQQTKT